MISLSSLPVEVLKEVFHHLNQHYTLTLAPLHSRFYYIAKPKLYRNIYVYSPWPIYDESKKPKDWNETFHISKSLNNLKSKKYTIISSDTLERYLAKMDRAQEIYHFELYVYNVTMIDCILRHFTTIRYFETLLNYKPPEPGESADYKVYNSLDLYHDVTVLVSPDFRQYSDTFKLFHIPYRDLPVVLESVDRVKQLTEMGLRLVLDWRHKLFLCTIKVPVLEIYYEFMYMTGNFKLIDYFDTSSLRELSLKGDIDVNTFFSNGDLEKDFPHLVQLCLRLIGKRPSAVQDLRHFSHGKLLSLIVSTHANAECDARAVCDLTPRYPSSCINWWMEEPINGSMLHTHNMKVLSPNLPYGTIGYHFHSNEDLTKFKHTVVTGTGEVVEVKFKKWYTNDELYTIYMKSAWPPVFRHRVEKGCANYYTSPYW
ncbi:Grc3 protein [Candida orthopsilosis Co 90-125]|uniref:Grc3 protein n=1 Tax=Candida orthopsilosis (strain 90-125) TaxID=1136231 RepID=H8XB68_CANO9|nr:Grc3 protein [Candida orthopsilosis Co 90-125]CCG25316.1 Grc3 protein [Candida orthopsilosis Co 90-125]